MKKALLFSVLLHATFFTLLFIAISEFPAKSFLNEGEGKPIAVYIMNQPFLIDQKKQVSHDDHQLKKKSDHPIKDRSIKKENASKENSTLSQQPIPGSSIAILTLLHNAIQAQLQLYSDELSQFGKQALTLEFDLSPDGSLNHVRLNDKNISSDLKKELITLLTALSPIAGVRSLVQQETHFILPVKINEQR